MAGKSSSKTPRRRGRKVGNKPGTSEKKNGIQKYKHEKVPAKHTSLLITLTDDSPTWYSCGRQTPGRDDTITSHPLPSKITTNAQLVAQYRSKADELFQREVQNFNQSNTATSSDEKWVENTMKRGTLKDRIAAMSVIVSTNPIHKFHALDGLLAMAANPNARTAQMAAEALEDLFLQALLPSNRKLLSMEQRPLYLYEDGTKTLSPRILLLWRYEELLKQKYHLFLTQYLVHTLQNGLEVNKLSALRMASALLREAPEGEAQLLEMLVNKLGDPSKKIAAAAGHYLRLVLEQHVNMQTVIAREVQQLAHRPHLSPRALYNCIIFLNQLQLSANETVSNNNKNRSMKQPSLPASLVRTYFELFEVAVRKENSEGIKSRLLSALLTGVNRAHPYLPEQDKDLETHMDSLYRVVHAGPPSASTQALMLLFQVAVGPQQDNNTASKQVSARQDRFYRALYASLSQSDLISGRKHLTLYFNLLYKAMKHDTDATRVNAFAKRLLCTTMHASPPVMAASLFLVSEVMKTHSELKGCLVDVPVGHNAIAVLDSTKREPSVALIHNGESVASAPLWEASLISQHYHPSVSKFASGEIEYNGDPLRDFALAPFLDKFAYRNPKTKASKKRGESVAERRTNHVETPATLPVNDPSFLEKQDVDVQEEFFHKFFMERARRDEMKGIVRGSTRDSVDEEDEAFDVAENLNTDQIFDEAWETDSEEEAFVDSLAKKLIEDAAEAEIDLDDEDPDMEGWDDMYDGDAAGKVDDKDAFMDNADDSSSDEENSEELQLDEQSDGIIQGDAFMDATDSNSDSESDESDSHVLDDERIDSDDELVIVDETDSDDDSLTQKGNNNKKKRKTERNDMLEETFADASAYEELINKGWEEMKANRSVELDSEELGAPAAAPLESSSSSKKRKRHSKKRRTK